MLTDDDVMKCLASAGCYGNVKMTFESGPYCIDRPTINASLFAEAIESAATAPLLTRIAELEQQLVYANEVIDQRNVMLSNAQAEPLVLERLSISEAKTIVSQHVEGEMTGDDWTIINAVQSAIAAKNGAKLK